MSDCYLCVYIQLVSLHRRVQITVLRSVTSFTQLDANQTWENHAACTSYPEGECNRIIRNVVRCLQNSTS